MEDDKVAAGESDPCEYDEVVTTKDTKTIDTFSSHIIHARTYVLKMGLYPRALQYRMLI